MRRITLIALLAIFMASNCYALPGARLRLTHLACTAPVTGETGDDSNYLSGWSLTGGVCGTLYYRADWGGDGDPRWTVTLYSNPARTLQLGSGSGYASPVTISGSVAGSVAIVSGPEGNITFDGTLTR